LLIKASKKKKKKKNKKKKTIVRKGETERIRERAGGLTGKTGRGVGGVKPGEKSAWQSVLSYKRSTGGIEGGEGGGVD